MQKPQLVTMQEILELFRTKTGIAVTAQTVYRYIRLQRFPRNIGIGMPRRWLKEDVEFWIDDKMGKTQI